MKTKVSNLNRSKIFISIIILVIIMVVALGTYALSVWTSRDNTELTMRIGGDLAEVIFDKGNDINIQNIGPVFNYETDGEMTDFGISNLTSEAVNINVFFTITSISDNLKEESFKYVLMQSRDNTTYTKLSEGNFSGVSNGTVLNLVTNYSLNNSIRYKLIIYIDGNVLNPTTMQNGSLVGFISADANGEHLNPELNQLAVNFSVVEGTVGDNNYYTSDVELKLETVNDSNLDSSYTPVYTLTTNDDTSASAMSLQNKVIATPLSSSNKYTSLSINKSNIKMMGTSNNFTVDTSTGRTIVTITEEGANMDFCISLAELNSDAIKTFCYSDKNNRTLSIDKTAPVLDASNITFDKNINSLIVGNATDNVTGGDGIRYYLTYDTETESTGGVSKPIDSSFRGTKNVQIYVKDRAGHASEPITKTLTVSDSQTQEIEEDTYYTCSLNSLRYGSFSNAEDDCKETGDVSSDKIYICSLDNEEYYSKSTAEANCTEQGDYSTEYFCDGGGTLNGTKCYEESYSTGTTKYDMQCEAVAGVTYDWTKDVVWTGESNCNAFLSTCSSASDLGNRKTTCSENSDGTYDVTDYTCDKKTSSSTVYQYTSVTSRNPTTGCPSGATSTLDHDDTSCVDQIGNSCSSSCSSCCTEQDDYICVSSYYATKEYYCEEDGEYYANKSACERVGDIDIDYIYYCDLTNDEYDSRADAVADCEETGNVEEEKEYYCPLTGTTSTDQTTQQSNCTNYCSSGTYSNGACYSFK